MADKAERAPKRSINRSQTSPCSGSPKTKHRVTGEDATERRGGDRGVEANTRIDDVLRHIPPAVTVDDALKNTIANTIRNTAADIKSKGGTTAVTANLVALRDLRCWGSRVDWIGGQMRYYFLNYDDVAAKRDIKPIGGLVDPSAQLTGEFDCMGETIPIVCGESGSGKTFLALRKAEGLVIHANVNSAMFKSLCSFRASNSAADDARVLADGIAEPILRELRSLYRIPSGNFLFDSTQTLTIVLDEMGQHQDVVRALCRHHSSVRNPPPVSPCHRKADRNAEPVEVPVISLAEKFGVGRVGLIIVGTGAETGANTPGSPPDNYSLHRLPRLPDYWEKHYEALKRNAQRLPRTLADFVLPVSKLSKRTRLSPLHALVLRLCGNARFAAIFARAIQEHKLCTLTFNCGDSRAGLECALTPAAATVALMAVANNAIAFFVDANGLSKSRGCLLADIAVAAELAVNGATWQRAMTHPMWNLLNRSYGIVTSAMEKVGGDAARALASGEKHTIIRLAGNSTRNKRNAGFSSFCEEFLMLPHGTPVVQMSEFGAAILLLERGLLWVPDGTTDGFAWTVASAVALYCMMPDVNLQDSANVDTTVLTPLRLLLNGLGSLENKQYANLSNGREKLRRVQRWLSPVQIDDRRMQKSLLSHPGVTPAWLAKVREWVMEGASVVTINGPMASYADVIVFAPGRLVLLQCMNFEGTRLLTDAMINEAFAKMVPLVNTEAADDGGGRGALTEKLIAACLGEDQLVRTQQPAGAVAPVTREFVVEAAIVFEGPRSCIDSEVLPAGEMSASYRYQGSESHVVAYTTAKVTFRFHVIDVTKDPRSNRLHGLHPVAQTSWLEAQHMDETTTSSLV